MAELSPMMNQYLEMKNANPDTLLFFRLGDFYELFFEDAKTASRELELTLTGRDCGLEERAPMCGVPFHSYEGYVAKLVKKGYKVAICEQLEDPSLAKGLVKRGITRVITPGTVIEASMLEEGKNNYLCSIYLKTIEKEHSIGLCFGDISTGEIAVTELSGKNIFDKLSDELSRFMPKELVINPAALSLDGLQDYIKQRLGSSVELLTDEECSPERNGSLLKSQFSSEQLENCGISGKESALCSVGAMLCYLEKTQKTGLERMNRLEYYFGEQYMRLDVNALRNLELTETMRQKEKKGSLLWVLDRTKTAMGKRLIKKWLERPLLNPAKIHARLNAVEELVSDDTKRNDILDALTGIGDLERLMTRIVYGSANARELRGVSYTAQMLPKLKTAIENVSCALLREVKAELDCLEDIKELIDKAIVDEPPITVREGNMIRDGFNADIDELRGDRDGGKNFITRIENSEREKTGIPKLRIGYNRVFGYYIEILNSYKNQVPEEYIRKQTLANCERYITQELKELEGRVLGAQDRLVKLEFEVFEEVRSTVAAALPRVQQTALAISKLDVFCSFASVSVSNRYVRPVINNGGRIVLSESRHPVVETLLDVPFVPNDVLLDNGDNRVAIITGPNMAGKSTYMRQCALIVLMAQAGCFVPAQNAEIGIVDGIYTRVGASDDLSVGQSTFMVEMSEVADILKNASSASLLILDEIGRGTSTFDGMSIARAVLEYAGDRRKLGAKTMFATHYHELTVMESSMKGVKNYNIAAKKHGDDITFLRRIVRGGADDSYGIEVAKLAGVPNWVIKRAHTILEQLESGKQETVVMPEYEQTVLPTSSPGEQEALFRLKNTDINKLSPMDAMVLLNELIKLAD